MAGLAVKDELKAALSKVRADKAAEDYVVARYVDDKTLGLLSTGSGGADAAQAHLLADDICYGLVRQGFNVDKAGTVSADTTKFIFFTWRPDSIPLKRKMAIGKFDGDVKKLFHPSHTSLECTHKEELTGAILAKLLAEVTMTRDAVTDKKSTGMLLGGVRLSLRDPKGDAKAAQLKPDSRAEFKVVEGAKVAFADEAALVAAIKDVRNDTTPTRWALAGYADQSTVALLGSGSGDVSEMLSRCKDTQPAYGLIRVSEQFDKTSRAIFCFVVWSPPNVPAMMRARVSTHKGAITPLFRPYSHDFVVAEEGELSEAMVLDAIASLTGTKSHVTDKKPQVAEDKFERKFLGGVKADTQKLEFLDREALLVQIAAVRHEKDGLNWLVVGFEGDKKEIKLKLCASGRNGLQEMVNAFKADKVMFGLLRNKETVDRSQVVRFYLVNWHGAGVNPTTKAYTGVLAGAVAAVFSPYNDDWFGSTVDEVIANGKKKVRDLA